MIKSQLRSRSVQAELDPVLTLVETYWAQRDKIQWLGLADRNTKIRRARHHIRHCEDYSGFGSS